MSTVPHTFTLPSGLGSKKSLLRAHAFHQLVDLLWQENEARPGCSLLKPESLSAIPALVNVIGDASSPHRDRVAWLLGLLAEALDHDSASAAAEILRQHLAVFLEAVDGLAHTALADGVSPQIGGLLFLLGHFPEDAAQIVDRLSAALGTGSPSVHALGMIFSTASRHPERSKFILTYLGAEGCSTALDLRLKVFEETLACLACHGKLNYREHQITCRACQLAYDWCGDIPNLVMPECTDPEQYPEAIVGIYESQSRPRFVRTMAGDWSGVVTPLREEAYIARYLRPVSGPVVDLACGAGGWTNLVARQVGVADVVAVDYSLPMLRACGDAVPGVSLVRASASALPFGDSSLGGMNCSDALQALPDPALALAEASRCLRPGAPMTVFTFREADSPYAYFQHRLPANARLLFSDAQIRDLAEKSGFDIVDMGGPGHAMFFTLQKRA